MISSSTAISMPALRRGRIPSYERLQRRFGKDRRFVFRNFPLTEVHPEAGHAAVTAEFGAANKRFWEVHDALFENQQRSGSRL